ncbi:hypothetical protein SCLCIDRAFT_1209334 [Scleroderma citrinum Foug A]|uniref:DUF7918 domain-containing protein n=1 Tax=Scleroderma citrinum Foug A TaxID=1036808 RepID=A0A0C3A4B4_9AGAM|nr:hypothetical protein SCLCIDRAFT_1209334 [Scleroderma citrinum Foug A]
MRVGEFSANILVGDKELEEYEVTVDASGTQATCWVASEVGKKFTVRWKCHSQKRLIENAGRVRLDGTPCGGMIMGCGCLGQKDTAHFSSISRGTMERDFVFSNLQLSDDEALLGRPVSKHLGEISVDILHGTAGPRRVDMEERLPSLLDHSDKKHERMVKKLSSHCVGFGQQRTIQRKQVSGFIPNNSPPVIFTFKYRPIAILQANGIAPRHEDISQGATPEKDSTAVLEKIHLLENELKRLRDQVLDNTTEGPQIKRIKKECGVSEKRPIISGEVIDLT